MCARVCFQADQFCFNSAWGSQGAADGFPENSKSCIPLESLHETTECTGPSLETTAPQWPDLDRALALTFVLLPCDRGSTVEGERCIS